MNQTLIRDGKVKNKFKSWAKKKFVIACITVLLKGVLGILSSKVFDWIMEVFMKLPTCNLGVLGGLAVLWGSSLLPLRRQHARMKLTFSRDP